jgi:hypothetical protein
VIFSRARKLILDEGPSQREVWTTAPTVGQALAGLGVQAQPIQMSTSPNTAIPLAGLALELRVPHKVTLTDGTGAKKDHHHHGGHGRRAPRGAPDRARRRRRLPPQRRHPAHRRFGRAGRPQRRR